MRAFWSLVAALVILVSAHRADAHELRQTSLILDIGSGRVAAELEIPRDQLALATKATDEKALARYVEEHLTLSSNDTFARKIESVTISPTQVIVRASFTPPPGGSTTAFRLDCDVVQHEVIPHRILVSLRKDFSNGVLEGDPELIDVLGFQHSTMMVDRGGSTWKGARAVFELGMRHIAEGSDHLLFLLVLLLPIPLLATGRVKAIAKTVTAFTAGHSITLALAALNVVHPPSRVVECLIAVSILVSALHAARPIFVGREAVIAGAFGLIHGLAFASTLREFGFDGRTMLVSLVSFNLGIEAMQLLVIAAVMPSLVVLGRSPRYALLRYGGVVVATTAAAAWLFERALGWSNPVGPLVDRVGKFGIPIAVTLAAVALWSWLGAAQARRRSQATVL